jgi:hypothetical protein
MLIARDILLEDSPAGVRPVAVFDLGERQIAAVAVAVDALRRERYAHPGLEVDDVLALADLRALSDQVELLEVAATAGTLRVAIAQVRLLAEATGAYLMRGEEETYQPPELRDRLVLLSPLAHELLDLVSDLHEAQRQLDERR